MTEYTLRRNLMERHDMTWDEAEDELNNRASDAYDREQDRKAEEYFNDDKS
jgi:hypothetical protein